MNIGMYNCMLIFVLIKQTWSIPLDHISTVCIYNGKSYKDEEIVKTEEPCLMCSCNKGSLNCNLRVCTDISSPVPPGCYVIHKEGECCSQLFCEKDHYNSGIEIRTLESKNKITEKNDCVKNGITFAEGSAVDSSELCEYCYCLRGKVNCIKPHCNIPFEGCTPKYQESSCCPTHYDCRNKTNNGGESRKKGCVKDSIFYDEGEKISSESSDRCEVCYCVRGDIQCSPIVCLVERSFENCIPLLQPGQCCPSSFLCEKSKLNSPNYYFKGKSHKKRTNVIPYKRSEINFEFSNRNSLKTKPDIIKKSKAMERNGVLEYKKKNFGFQNTTELLSTKETNNRQPGVITSDPKTTLKALMPSYFDLDKDVANVSAEFQFTEDTETKIKNFLLTSLPSSGDYSNYIHKKPRPHPSRPDSGLYSFEAADAITNNDSIEVLNKPKKFQFSTIKTPDGLISKKFTLSSMYNVTNIKEQVLKNNGAIVPEGVKITTLQSNLEFSPVKQSFESLHGEYKTSDIKPFSLKGVIKKISKNDAFSVPDINPLWTNQSVTKPVTVTYKNAVQNYYPYYPITSLKEKLEMSSNIDLDTESSQASASSIRKITSNKSFAKENQFQVYSSTQEPITETFNLENFHENYFKTLQKSLPNVKSNQSSLFLNNVIKSLFKKERSSTPKLILKDSAISSPIFSLNPFVKSSIQPTERIFKKAKNPFITPTADTKIFKDRQESQFLSSKNSSNKESYSKSGGRNLRNKDNKKTYLGTVLKLSGCNIYGRVYGIGKTIVELSGPCQKCICTDSGVKCTSLEC